MFKTLSGLKDKSFWRVQHQITATAYLVRDESCGSPLYLSPAGGLSFACWQICGNFNIISNKSQEKNYLDAGF